MIILKMPGEKKNKSESCFEKEEKTLNCVHFSQIVHKKLYISSRNDFFFCFFQKLYWTENRYFESVIVKNAFKKKCNFFYVYTLFESLSDCTVLAEMSVHLPGQADFFSFLFCKLITLNEEGLPEWVNLTLRRDRTSL